MEYPHHILIKFGGGKLHPIQPRTRAIRLSLSGLRPIFKITEIVGKPALTHQHVSSMFLLQTLAWLRAKPLVFRILPWVIVGLRKRPWQLLLPQYKTGTVKLISLDCRLRSGMRLLLQGSWRYNTCGLIQYVSSRIRKKTGTPSQGRWRITTEIAISQYPPSTLQTVIMAYLFAQIQ